MCFSHKVGFRTYSQMLDSAVNDQRSSLLQTNQKVLLDGRQSQWMPEKVPSSGKAKKDQYHKTFYGRKF